MLELQGITVDVDNGDSHKEILRDVSLTVGDGRVLVLTGPNGGGKSTLAKVIAGIIRPQQGRLLLDGRDITQAGITERAKLGVGYAFQQPVRFKGLTVRDLLALASGGTVSERELCACLRDVGLCARDYIDREADASLSGGEIKRIEIAMVMARRSRLTIFDEPEAGIDLWSFNNLIDVFETLRREVRGAMILISHQERIMQIADEIAVLANGRLVSHGARGEILPTLSGEGAPCRFCAEPENRRVCQ